ncbi:MAG TPA: DUF885 family protein [Rhodanobacter sp.]|nr:DUF885 family protein [Rhodanobacter sp.]
MNLTPFLFLIGEQTILSLRDEAKRKRGDKYNVKIFDDVVLGQGSLPMAVLKEVVNKWIDNTLAGKPVDQLPFACKPRSLSGRATEANAR